jgi:hypothetical protein
MRSSQAPTIAKRPSIPASSAPFAWQPHFREPVDVVYTWVDGSDPIWQASLLEWAEKELPASAGISKKRFKDRDELRYSLRSILQYAPWINHIYIVTCGHQPSWLIPHPKITIIPHSAIFTCPANLPTFNSMAIECHLHRIPGLREYYLYFNDDVFLGKPTTPDTFFTPDGKIRIFLSENKLPQGIPEPGEEGFRAAIKNTSALLDARYGAKRRKSHAHTAFPSKRSFTDFLTTQFPNVFSSVASHRFRSLKDYAITNGLVPYAALYTDHGVISETSRITIGFGKDTTQDEELLASIVSEQPQFFCIQDSSDEDVPESLELLHSFFESYFPEKAPWEEQQEEELPLANTVSPSRCQEAQNCSSAVSKR